MRARGRYIDARAEVLGRRTWEQDSNLRIPDHESAAFAAWLPQADVFNSNSYRDSRPGDAPAFQLQRAEV